MARKSGEALEILDQLDASDPRMQRGLQTARGQAAVAQLFYDARTAA